MQKTFLQSAVLLALLLVVYAWTSRPKDPPPGWGDDFATAIEAAGAGNKLVVIDFYQRGCGPCMHMEQDVLPDAKVTEALDGYVPIRLNALENREVSLRYRIAETPTFVVIDADGRMVDRASGTYTPTEFAAFLTDARRRADAGDYVSQSATPGAP